MKNTVPLIGLAMLVIAGFYLLFAEKERPKAKVETCMAFALPNGSVVITGLYPAEDTLFVWAEYTAGEFSEKSDVERSQLRLSHGPLDTLSFIINPPFDSKSYSFRFACIRPKDVTLDSATVIQYAFELDAIYLNKFVEYGEAKKFQFYEIE